MPCALQDNLLPISCKGQDWQGGMALTLVDSLDALVVGGGQWQLAACEAQAEPARTCPGSIARGCASLRARQPPPGWSAPLPLPRRPDLPLAPAPPPPHAAS